LVRSVISAVVISRDDGARILPAVRSVVAQECDEPFEVIVVTSGSDGAADLVKRDFPEVTVIELERPALPGEARNAGLRVARGDYVSFPGSHVELPPGSLASRLRAHRLGYRMVTGTVLNGTRSLAGWASYFLDHSTSLPDRPSGELDGPPMHCSYERGALLTVGGFPERIRAGEDTVVNRALFERGHVAYRAQDVRFTHNSRCRTPVQLLRHHFSRGRAFGTILRAERDPGRVLIWTYVPRRISQTGRNVRRWGGELRSEYRRAWPLVVAGTVAAWFGLLYELLRSPGGQVSATSPPSVATNTRQK
jgi:glycosyltransferase involved in cell wall biosynthesis